MKISTVTIIGLLFTCLYSTQAFAQQEARQKLVDPDTPYAMVEQMPVFIGGEKALTKHMVKHLKKYKGATKSLVVVTFIIHQDSTVSDIKMQKSFSPEVDNLVIKAVEATNKKWVPGRQFDVPVKVNQSLPIVMPFVRYTDAQIQVSPAQ